MSITEQALRQAVNGGYRTLKDIGSDFGVTRQHIHKLCARYGIDRGVRRQHIVGLHSRWPRERLTVLKRRLGLCLEDRCYAQPMPERARCAEHLKAHAERVSRYYAAHRARGLCYHCNELPVPGHTMCQHHLDMLRVANRHRRAA